MRYNISRKKERRINRMKRIPYILLCSVAVAVSWNSITTRAEAGYKEDAISDLYNQLVIDESNTAQTYYPAKDFPRNIEMKQYVADQTDDPNNLFDGAMLYTRGYRASLLKDNVFTINLVGSYDVTEADILTDKMVAEITETLRDGASDREKMAAICNYVSEHFDYDYETGDSEKNGEYSERNNFVDAYYGDNKKILCTDFAALTYLLANKMDINCELMFGETHVYNRVKFKGSSDWIGYDLAKDSRYSQITSSDFEANKHLYEVNGDSEEAAGARILNKGRTYKTAGIAELLISCICLGLELHCMPELLVIGTILIAITSVLISVINYLVFCAHRRAYRNRRKAARA